MTNKELHKYFYEKHQSFWEMVIEVAKKEDDQKYILNITNIKRRVKNILYPNIDLACNCFGCHFAYKPINILFLDCKNCFLNLKCLNNYSYWVQLNRTKDKKEFIELCKKIRDCGFRLTRSKIKMMKLYKEMNK